MESDDAIPRSVVRDVLGSLGLFAGEHGATVEHATVTVDSPIPRMPRPHAGASPRPSRPAPVPDTIDGYASSFSRMMAGPQAPLPAPAHPEPASGPTTTAPTIPRASAPPLMPNSNETSPEIHVIASDSGRLSPTLNDVAATLERYIDHNDSAMQTLSERSLRLKPI